MTVAMIHGNPETDAIWRQLVSELTGRGVNDVVLLSPPGFGAPIPENWTATRQAYRDWLIREVESLTTGGPVDLVGHDWGAGHVFGLLETRPDLIRSWACDVVGLLHPDYVWHDAAQVWQSPGLGEQAVAMMTELTMAERKVVFQDLGMQEDAAVATAESLDDMLSCVLPLYRSAKQPVCAELGTRLAEASASSRRPSGLALNPTEDPYVGHGAEAAALLMAEHAPMYGAGHWWMTERPEEAADILVEFWNSLRN